MDPFEPQIRSPLRSGRGVPAMPCGGHRSSAAGRTPVTPAKAFPELRSLNGSSPPCFNCPACHSSGAMAGERWDACRRAGAGGGILSRWVPPGSPPARTAPVPKALSCIPGIAEGPPPPGSPFERHRGRDFPLIWFETLIRSSTPSAGAASCGPLGCGVAATRPPAAASLIPPPLNDISAGNGHLPPSASAARKDTEG